MLKSRIYDFIICRGGTDMCFVLGFGRKRPDLKQYCISGLTTIKPISGAVVGDSSLQDRGVAHYLLPLLFSLVSLPFSFYLCVPYQKYQKYLLSCMLLLLWVPLKHQVV